jgi:hypothetical protein
MNKKKTNKFTWYSIKNLGLFVTVKSDLPYKSGLWVLVGTSRIANEYQYQYEKTEVIND